jgi:16S rRNA processing protein RimM
VSPEEIVTVGRLGRTRGLTGEIYVTVATDFPQRFSDLEQILVKGKDGWDSMKIVSVTYIADRPVLKLENIDNPEQAARLTNRELGVPMSQVVNLPEDTFYVFDLVGCEVFTESDDKPLGEVIDVEDYPAADLYVVKLTDGEMLRIPAVKQYVKEVDVSGKRIVVDITGLLDEH